MLEIMAHGLASFLGQGEAELNNHRAQTPIGKLRH